MPNIEEQLDGYLKNLSRKPGERLSGRVPELESFAPTLSLLATLPRRAAPQPSLRRRYLHELPAKAGRFAWLSFLHLSRAAFVSSLVTSLLLATGGTAFGAYRSIPGEKLYSVKKAAEHVQLSFASSPTEKAVLQVKFANKRADDVRKALATSKPKLKTAALTELAAQTRVAVENVQAVAREPDAGGIVTALVDLKADQDSIVAEAEAGGQAAEQVKDLKNTLAIAATLSAGSASATGSTGTAVTVIGAEASSTASAITVGTSTMAVVVGTSTASTTLAADTPATATGSASTTPGKVKGTSTEPVAAPAEAPEAGEAPAAVKDRTAAGFIVEDPRPQFVP